MTTVLVVALLLVVLAVLSRIPAAPFSFRGWEQRDRQARKEVVDEYQRRAFAEADDDDPAEGPSAG